MELQSLVLKTISTILANPQISREYNYTIKIQVSLVWGLFLD